jgi:hypothetical protein
VKMSSTRTTKVFKAPLSMLRFVSELRITQSRRTRQATEEGHVLYLTLCCGSDARPSELMAHFATILWSSHMGILVNAVFAHGSESVQQ